MVTKNSSIPEEPPPLHVRSDSETTNREHQRDDVDRGVGDELRTVRLEEPVEPSELPHRCGEGVREREREWPILAGRVLASQDDPRRMGEEDELGGIAVQDVGESSAEGTDVHAVVRPWCRRRRQHEERVEPYDERAHEQRPPGAAQDAGGWHGRTRVARQSERPGSQAGDERDDERRRGRRVRREAQRTEIDAKASASQGDGEESRDDRDDDEQAVDKLPGGRTVGHKRFRDSISPVFRV
jgi:hypothetical protein